MACQKLRIKEYYGISRQSNRSEGYPLPIIHAWWLKGHLFADIKVSLVKDLVLSVWFHQ